ncbi:MAG: hypothetical protein KJ879_03090 [Nanoarchaeota archaeon]|nr:hypothetical protein [Nanoarchaeota archaeon]
MLTNKDKVNKKVQEPQATYAIQNSFSHYEEDVYTKVAVQALMTFGIYSVIQNKETCTFERLVAECFLFFPKVFGIKRYPQWPDTLKFDRATRSLREKGLTMGGIGGKHSPGEITLTELGKKIAKQTEDILNNKIPVLNYKAKKSSPTDRSIDDKLIKYLKENPHFKKYLNNPKFFAISEPDFRNILRCTLETPWRVVKQNLEYFKQLAKSYNEREIIDFLSFCENKFFNQGEKNG